VSAKARWKRLWWLAAMFAAAMLAALAVLFVVFGGSTGSAPKDAPGDAPKDVIDTAARGPGSPSGSWPRSHDTALAAAESTEAEPPGMPAMPDTDDSEYPVDLERLRSQIPDNLYWRLGEPTLDPETLRTRAEEEQRWNELYGKVQSSTATEDEVHRYYEHRRQLSHDYIEFASLVLETYGDRLPERDRGMYELSIELHTARLAEIPRQVEDALARRSAHEQRKKEWQESQGNPAR
jgi:hypothetical protein